MEAHKEAMAYSNSNSSAGESPSPVVVKRKRTKRHRAAFQPPAAASSASSNELSGTTEVEEDMANCLILLAQGPGAAERFISRRFNEAATTAGVRVGFCVYECKTCSKCFPSFQALGGHRASHKKPKVTAASDRDSELLQIGMSSFSKPMASPDSGGKPRTHECSICGSEFSSGQALGGHMRRHRPAVVSENSSELKKEKAVLSLDLNLPPPPTDDDLFTISRKPLVFSPSAAVALLDCHY